MCSIANSRYVPADGVQERLQTLIWAVASLKLQLKLFNTVLTGIFKNLCKPKYLHGALS